MKVIAGGQTVAETLRPKLLIETGLPVRYYIPREDIRMELLRPSEKNTRCPYKGLASYWSLHAKDKTLEDIAWSYMESLPESLSIKGLLSFYNERIDTFLVDGEQETNPPPRWF